MTTMRWKKGTWRNGAREKHELRRKVDGKLETLATVYDTDTTHTTWFWVHPSRKGVGLMNTASHPTDLKTAKEQAEVWTELVDAELKRRGGSVTVVVDDPLAKGGAQ